MDAKAHKQDGVEMCINIYDVRLEDTAPACGMNWPPEMPAINKLLAVCLHPTLFIIHNLISH